MKNNSLQTGEFIPKRVFFEPAALDYPLGRKLHKKFLDLGIPLFMTTNHNRVTGLPGKTPAEKYYEAKNTLVVGVRKSLDFPPCKPSAHYQLPLVTSCPGMCQYCYLATTLGPRPYIRVYVNLEEILLKAKTLIAERKPKLTYFEGAATSDPLPVEYLTGSLGKAISFFASEEYGRFRFVSKFTGIESLLHLEHKNHTTIRFSINTPQIIAQVEHGTPGLSERLQAARRVAEAGYPLGLLIAPILTTETWEEEYTALLQETAAVLGDFPLTFELITHRYTQRAKKQILSVFPHTPLVMEEKERKAKYGQFGYIKYLYPPETMEALAGFFSQKIAALFPQGEISYFV